MALRAFAIACLLSLATGTLAGGDLELSACVQFLRKARDQVPASLLAREKTANRLLKTMVGEDRESNAGRRAAAAALAWLGSALSQARTENGAYFTIPLLPGFKHSSLDVLSKAEQAAYRLTLKDGKLYKADGTLFDTSSASVAALSGKRRAIIIMDAEGNFYASTIHEAGRFNHATLARGQNVAFAGEIEARDGVITVITNQSGHYLPSTAFTLQAIESFRRQRIPLTTYEMELYEHRLPDEPTRTPLTLRSPY